MTRRLNEIFNRSPKTAERLDEMPKRGSKCRDDLKCHNAVMKDETAT